MGMTKPPSLAPARAKPKSSGDRSLSPAAKAVTELLGQRIRKVRTAKGVTQEGLAYSIPIDRAHMGQIENGKKSPTFITLVKIALALNCEVTAFIPKLSEIRGALRESEGER